MPTIAPAHDPDATGPRDWRELAAMRAAHATMPHAAALAALDRARVDAAPNPARTRKLTAAARDAYKLAREPRAYVRASDGQNDDKNTEARTATERAALAIAAARAAMRADRSPWPLAPCPVNAPRCRGHATIRSAADAYDLRRTLRAARPLRRPAGRIPRAGAILPDDRSAAA